jgi:hypothetical protein
MDRMHILGAGASRGYASSKTGCRPPLANDFLNTFNKLEQNITVLCGKTLNYLMDRRGSRELLPTDWTIDVEALLTEIGDKVMAAGNKEGLEQPIEVMKLIATYTELVYLLSWTLNEIQNGPVCEVYSRFAHKCMPGEFVVTLNWDTLLDRALMSTGRWHPDDGYYTEFDAILDHQWRRPDQRESDLQLLKLHGSTNWIIPAIVYRFDAIVHQNDRRIQWEPIPVSCYVHSEDEYVTYQGRWLPGYEPFSYCYYPPNLPMDIPNEGPIAVSPTALSIPLIVPPLRQKPYALFRGLIDHLWDRALQQISKVYELVLVGYSVPETDTRPLDLMKHAVERGRLKRILIVNPSPQDAAARVKSATNRIVPVVEVRSTFESYVDRM